MIIGFIHTIHTIRKTTKQQQQLNTHTHTHREREREIERKCAKICKVTFQGEICDDDLSISVKTGFLPFL